MNNKPRSERDAAFLARHRRLGAEDDRPARGSALTITIAGEVLRESASGAAVLFWDGTREVWLPKSQIKAAEIGLEMPEWLAKDKGLI